MVKYYIPVLTKVAKDRKASNGSNTGKLELRSKKMVKYYHCTVIL